MGKYRCCYWNIIFLLCFFSSALGQQSLKNVFYQDTTGMPGSAADTTPAVAIKTTNGVYGFAAIYNRTIYATNGASAKDSMWIEYKPFGADDVCWIPSDDTITFDAISSIDTLYVYDTLHLVPSDSIRLIRQNNRPDSITDWISSLKLLDERK